MSKEVNEERTPRTVEDVKEMLSKHSNGEIQRTIQNCITILQNDHVLADAIRLNLLSERIDIVKPVGWPRSGKTLSDTDMKYILRRMEKYGISSEKKIESAIRIVANENRYHPIRDYLNGLKWDGTERIAHVLHHFLGAAEDEYTCEAMKIFLLGAIKRVFQPGCKFETMLCLVGGQGAGKSTFFRLLAVKDEWFSDDLRRLDDDNVYRKLQGHWIIEMSEMIATANATRACAKNPPDTGYPVSGGSVILRLYGGSAQRLLFGERLVPDLNGLELGHPAVRFKLAFPCIQQTLLGAPLCGLGHIRVGHIRKGGCACGFGSACGVPHQHRAFCIASRDRHIACTCCVVHIQRVNNCRTVRIGNGHISVAVCNFQCAIKGSLIGL